jgi:hypothetical protein
MATCELMIIMIDVLAYATGYVLVSKLIECRRDKFIKDWLGTAPNTPKVTVIEPVKLKKHPVLKPPHIIE